MLHTPKIQIAYADDHELVRKGIIGFVNATEDLEVIVEAGNGKELIEKLERKAQIPPVCIIDVNMPEMDGFDTIIALRKRWPNVKVIVVSVFENEYYIIRMIRNGANAYLTKSCSPNELINAIRTVYENDIYYSDQVTKQFINAIKKNEVALPSITALELELLKLSCTDLTYTEIANKIKVSPRSVENFRDNLFKKLNVKSRTGLAMFAVQFGLVPIEVNATPKIKL